MSREEAVAAAALEEDPSSLAAGERLRKQFGPDLAAWALTQVELRRRAVGRLERANEMWFTRAGMEQATRTDVARWRAQRFVEAGVQRVWDVGCGIGSDAMAFAEAGIEVIAIEADPETAEIATHNLALVGAGPARCARAEELAIPETDAVFLDPARRTARGRTWNVADFTPPWELALSYLESERFVCVKMGPGVPKEILPENAEWCWVSQDGDVVEASIWNRRAPGISAVLSQNHSVEPKILEIAKKERYRMNSRALAVLPAGKYIAEPDGAAIRAGLIPEAVGEGDAWLLAEGVAYVSCDEPIQNGWFANFAVRETLPYDRKALTKWVRENKIGTLEIKKRAVDVDPAVLRKQLKPKGPNCATLLISPTIDGARVFVVERLAVG